MQAAMDQDAGPISSLAQAQVMQRQIQDGRKIQPFDLDGYLNRQQTAKPEQSQEDLKFRGSDGRVGESRAIDHRTSDLRNGDPRTGDPRTGDYRRGEMGDVSPDGRQNMQLLDGNQIAYKMSASGDIRAGQNELEQVLGMHDKKLSLHSSHTSLDSQENLMNNGDRNQLNGFEMKQRGLQQISSKPKYE